MIPTNGSEPFCAMGPSDGSGKANGMLYAKITCGHYLRKTCVKGFVQDWKTWLLSSKIAPSLWTGCL